MFDDNKYIEQDNLFRSILEEGQEPVPAHVWEGIEADLNRIDRRRVVALYFRRAAAGMAAAAAVAVGLFFSLNGSDDIISPSSDEGMIAVVEPDRSGQAEADILIAKAEDTGHKPKIYFTSSETPADDASESMKEETVGSRTDVNENVVAEDTGVTDMAVEKGSDNKPYEPEVHQERFPDVWPEDEKETRRSRVRSVTVSGLTGTNSTQNSSRVNPMRRPALSSAPRKTGIKETSTNTTYGVPISFGAGVRFDISKKWSVGTGLNYTLLTRKFYGTYTTVDSKGVEVNSVSSDIHESQHFIGIPVNFYYDIVNQKNIKFYTYAGGAAEKCISDKFQLLDTDIRHTEKVKGLQWSANLGMGVEFMLGRHLGIYVDPSLRYYFKNSQPKSIRTAQPLMFGLEMGLRVNL